jgi:hypothetical protein
VDAYAFEEPGDLACIEVKAAAKVLVAKAVDGVLPTEKDLENLLVVGGEE